MNHIQQLQQIVSDMASEMGDITITITHSTHDKHEALVDGKEYLPDVKIKKK